MTMSPVVQSQEVAPHFFGPEGGSDRYGAEMIRLSALLGLEGLGVKQICLAPGKAAFPMHNHHNNDELFIIIEGMGEYRLGEDRHAIAAGSVCAAPRGGPDKAHQIVNTGAQDLVYFAISTMNRTDIVEYPESGKFLARSLPVEASPGAGFEQLRFKGAEEDYWDGER